MSIDEKAKYDVTSQYCQKEAELINEAINKYEAAKDQPPELSSTDYAKFKKKFSAKYHVEPEGHQVAWGWNGYHYAMSMMRESGEVDMDKLIEAMRKCSREVDGFTAILLGNAIGTIWQHFGRDHNGCKRVQS